jgi:hypothetical protein
MAQYAKSNNTFETYDETMDKILALLGRIVSIVDMFDAFTSVRPHLVKVETIYDDQRRDILHIPGGFTHAKTQKNH